MLAARSAWITGALGLCLVTATLLKQQQISSSGPARAAAHAWLPPPPRRSPADQALWESRRWRLKALMAVNRERELVEAWDSAASGPHGVGSIESDEWRLEQMARDQGGYLRRAREAAWRATVLALTPQEGHRAAEHLARIEHESGQHLEELRQARRMMSLDPQHELSLVTLRRATACNGLAAPTRRASVAVDAVPPSSVIRGQDPPNE